jgi:Spy/CpxP family protein refolding chaperone
MKAKTFLIASAAIAALQFAPVVSAQSPDGNQPGRHHRGHARFLANLSPEERAKLRAAHQQAMADPAVQAAKDRQRQAAREFRDLKRAKMLQADPTIQPILDKVPARGGGRS